MRILYFSPRDCWPLTTGARLRDYHLAQQLAKNNELTFVALVEPGMPAPAPPPESAGFRQVLIERGTSYTPMNLLRGLTGPLPVTLLNYTSAKAAATLAALLRENRFDSVQIEGIHLAEYVSTIRQNSPRSLIVADWHNIESELMDRYADGCTGLPRKLYARRTAQLIAQAENRLLAQCDIHTVVSEREKIKLAARNPNARIEVVPNGVDTDSYGSIVRDPQSARNVIFVGSMDYHANIDGVLWLAREIWPVIAAARPEWKLQIVGRSPVAAVRALASDRIEVTGTVDDVRPYYAQAIALAVPLRVGGGTRLKILEAMASGVPVVSTSLGAEGIEIQDGVHMFLKNNSTDFASAICNIRPGEPALERMVKDSQEIVNKRYSWNSIGAAINRLHSR